MASEVEKRLEEIEASAFVVQVEGDCVGVDRASFGWLTARLRDALVVIAGLNIRDRGKGYMIANPWALNEAVAAAYRRLFGEEDSRG